MSDGDEPAVVDTADTDRTDENPEDPAAHLQDVDDGCGCAEVWEHTSEQRED